MISSKMQLFPKDVGIFGVLYACWLICTEPQLLKHFHGHLPLLGDVAGAVAIAGLLWWLRSRKSRPPLSGVWLAAVWLLLAVLFLVLYPIAQRHVYGVGSDREDALQKATVLFLHGHFPYYVRTFLGNPVSPLPGAMLLAAPFLLLGHVGTENLFWLAIFLYCASQVLGSRAAVLVLVVIINLLSLGSLDDFVVGGDYIANFYYVFTAVFLFVQLHGRRAPAWQQVLSEIFLGVTLTSRAVYFIFLPLLLAYLLQRRSWTTALRAILVSAFVAGLLVIPLYLHDPAHFSPLHVEHKLDFLSEGIRNAVQKGLPMVALLVACCGFMVRLTMSKVFLLAGLSLAIVLGIPGILRGLTQGFSYDVWFFLSYSGPAACLLAIWAMLAFLKDPKLQDGSTEEASF